MPTRPFVRNDLNAPNVVIWTWSGLLVSDDGQPAEIIYGQGRIWVQVSGTAGSGGAVVIEGSITGANYGTLNTEGGGAASFSNLGGAALRGTPFLIRPRVSAGDSNTNFTVHIAYLGAKLPG